MNLLLNYIWRGWFIFLASIFTLLFCPIVLLLSIRASHFKYAYIFIRAWCLILFYGMGFRYELINRNSKKLDIHRQYIFIANHTSIIDIMLMSVLHSTHPICFIGKAELAKIPIFGLIYRRICILVDRKDTKSRANVYKKAAIKMSSGQNIVIFPEGGVPDDTSIILEDFKDGAFNLSEKHHFPIVVYTFVGLKKMFPFDNSKGHPGKISVILNDILEPEESQTMKHKAFTLIKNSLILTKSEK